MDFRKVFDTIPEQFERWRPKYCPAAFDHIIRETGLDSRKSVLEIGPGTGQATEPILKTGCDYLAVELGEHLCAYAKRKFAAYPNFHIVNADFETHDFGGAKFDVVFSAAAIQWIPEEIAFSRSYELLRSGGYLVMMLLRGDYQTPNQALFADIQKVYAAYFHPEIPYQQKLDYRHVTPYGFSGARQFLFPSRRAFSADEYVQYIGTHSDHIVLREPDRTRFYDGVRSAILAHGDKIVFDDTVVVYLAQKP